MRATGKLAAALCAAALSGSARAEDSIWAKLPWPSEILHAYPAATAGGQAGVGRVKCQPDRKGDLTQCVLLSEEPAGLGFGAAALALAPKFRLTRAAAKTYGAGIVTPIRFEPPPLAPPWREPAFQPHPGYSRYGGPGPYFPDRAAREEIDGEVLIDCHVGESGQLDRCQFAAIAPRDMGFDDAVRKMIEQGYISAGAPPADSSPPADGVWRFRVEFKAPR